MEEIRKPTRKEIRLYEESIQEVCIFLGIKFKEVEVLKTSNGTLYGYGVLNGRYAELPKIGSNNNIRKVFTSALVKYMPDNV